MVHTIITHHTSSGTEEPRVVRTADGVAVFAKRIVVTLPNSFSIFNDFAVCLFF